MSTSNLTVSVLQEIRDEVRGLRADQQATRTELTALRSDFHDAARRADERVEVIETSLRDMAQQLVLLARGIKVAIEAKGTAEERLDVLEERVAALEGARQG